MAEQAPKPPDFNALMNQQAGAGAAANAAQTGANRPNQQTPWGSLAWSQDENGNWTQSANLSPFMQGLMNRPGMDWSQFGAVGTGDEARNQATEAAYRSQMGMLQPQFEQAGNRMDQKLANQGLSGDSAAAQAARSGLAGQQNQAYGQARSAAIHEGNQAGNDVFRNNMMSRQQAISEALRARGMPLEEQRALMAFMGMPGFENAGRDPTPDFMGAGQAQWNADLGRWEMQNQADADFWNNVGQFASTAVSAAALSDERAKTDVVRHGVEVLPGVPLATWRWREASDEPTFGVIAQDLQRVRPDLVKPRADGMLTVDYAGLGKP